MANLSLLGNARGSSLQEKYHRVKVCSAINGGIRFRHKGVINEKYMEVPYEKSYNTLDTARLVANFYHRHSSYTTTDVCCKDFLIVYETDF